MTMGGAETWSGASHCWHILTPWKFGLPVVKYEDPLATKGLAGALDARQQNTGAIPVPQATHMEDIEQWLSTDVGDEAVDPKGVTSEEFDKFLEERAKVADRLPTVPSPSTGVPPPSTSSGPHRKKDKEEDAMFAL